ncbi:hypothetical protein AB4Y43_01230 [Paraburkholderia sp. BR10872]|uniref:hypothetical protein n=1 Tax=Paraburkholderia sp. BR10872 TaxID=3236989 RepID=UPI0034D2DF9F
MNIRDVAGVSTPAELYEIANHHGIHVGSMDHLVRFAVEIQRRALLPIAIATSEEALDRYLTKQEVPSGDD